MFYSQFILAKKGPLGTIWIAAHLERKLKKNQVADTDIGVSVDSILFPEVPIALRLSSHLLLGVVRIYSRKVNYLFHDCSEALLKVKQAFRSTAVDLPPEESTAPYHSITLPETFDLDDFELPDSALLSGNFDDRHVSTREQITLQDTLDGTGYSTSQFRLDERFGDGDASQISLDLDEELLLDNNLTLQDASVLDGAARQGQGETILVKMVIEEGQYGCDEDRNDDASKELSELLGNNRDNHVVSNVENVNRNDDSSQQLIFNIQTPDLNEVFLPADHIGGPSAAHDIDMDFATADPPSPECDQSVNFPSTPGLSEEAIRANFQELPDSNPQKISTDLEVETHDKPINQEAENLDATNGLTNAASTSPKSANLPQVVSSLTSVLAEPNRDSVVPVNDNGNKHDESKGLQLAVPVVSSSTSVLTEINPSPAAESLGGTLAGPDVPNSINLLQVESTDPKLAGISQVLPSSTLVLTEPVSDSLVPPCSGETISASGIDGILLEDTTKLSNLDQDRVGDSNSCQTGNFSALSSDFHLRSCTSESTQANLVSPCDVFQELFQERAQEFSFRGQPCNAETPLVGQQMHFSESSMDPQGLCSAIATDTYIRVDQKSDNIPVELSSNCISKDVQLGNCNYFSSSEFTEPERMRFAVSGNAILSNYLGQQTTEKGVTESDGSVDRISNLSGQKRRLIDSTLDLQYVISPKMSGILRKKRNNDYIPNDDDLLASILVGRNTPALRIGSTPPLPKPPSFKRPRLTAKAGLPKRRKVLLDDTIVLHADAIRQQLINTDDIRRMRKKAPCTRPEIWRIQKSSLEDDIFCESIFTGISKDLNTLLTRRYDLAQNIHSQISGHGSSGEAAKEVEHSKSSVFVRDADDTEMAEQNAVEPKKTVDGEMQGPIGTSKLIDAGSCKNALSFDAQERLESPLDLRHDDLQATTISRAELDTLEHTAVEMVTHSALNSGNECGIPTDSRIEDNRDDICTNQEQNSMNNNILHVADCKSFGDLTPADCAAGGRVDTSLQVEDFSNAKAASITLEDMGVDIVNVTNLDGPANVGKDDNGRTSVSMLDRFIVEVGADFPADSPIVSGYANASVPSIDLVGGGPVTSDQQAMDPEGGKVIGGCETVVDEEGPLSEVPDGEKPDVASFSILPSAESERVRSAVGENSSMNIEGGVDVEGTPMEFAAARESSDFCSAIDDIDTDFLNVDDEVEYDEETNNDEPNNEEAQFLENSGWSSRTRSVARYLKNLFDQESGGRRKSVAIDHLLAGKSRKEASRMFFETLVLKTRDYIHVEQENPFDCVNIKPRIKLLKSEF